MNKDNFIEELIKMFTGVDVTMPPVYGRQENATVPAVEEALNEEPPLQEAALPQEEHARQDDEAVKAESKLIDDPKKLIIYSEIMSPKFRE